MAVIPYVQGLSEALQRVYKKHHIQTAMKPHMTLRKLLVHPKDKRELLENSGVVYRVQCTGCDQAYIGETARNLGYRIDEHLKEVNITDNRKYTRSERKHSETEFNKSAITDHVARQNHVIDWENIKIAERDSNDKARLIKEAICIRKEKAPMNRDEGGTSSVTHMTLCSPL